MAGQALKPPFHYYGGKIKLAPRIAQLLPAHEHYVEPFGGSLAVLLAKHPSKQETVNDIDGNLLAFWRVLRARTHELERLALLTPASRAEYEAARGIDADDELVRAWQVWVTLTQGRSLSLAPSGWRSRIESRRPLAQVLPEFASRIAPAAERLRNVTLENRDAIELIERYGVSRDVCIYADPPYLGSTRASNYKHEMLSDQLHERLARALKACSASVVLSGYASPLYEELFEGWHRTELKAPAALSGRKAENEVLWSNRPLEAQSMFDFSDLQHEGLA